MHRRFGESRTKVGVNRFLGVGEFEKIKANVPKRGNGPGPGYEYEMRTAQTAQTVRRANGDRTTGAFLASWYDPAY